MRWSSTAILLRWPSISRLWDGALHRYLNSNLLRSVSISTLKQTERDSDFQTPRLVGENGLVKDEAWNLEYSIGAVSVDLSGANDTTQSRSGTKQIGCTTPHLPRFDLNVEGSVRHMLADMLDARPTASRGGSGDTPTSPSAQPARLCQPRRLPTFSNSIDTKEKPFACFCGRSFPRSDLLTRHKQYSHTITTNADLVPSREILQAAGHVGFGEVTPSGSDAHTSKPAVDIRQEESRSAYSDFDQDPLQDFGAFLDGIGLAPDWDSLDFLEFSNTPGRTDLTEQQHTVSERTIQGSDINTPSVTVQYGIAHQPISASTVAIDAHTNHPPDPIQWKLSEK
nr:hypothetical protein CFP56_33427 [Quercus suber]